MNRISAQKKRTLSIYSSYTVIKCIMHTQVFVHVRDVHNILCMSVRVYERVSGCGYERG